MDITHELKDAYAIKRQMTELKEQMDEAKKIMDKLAGVYNEKMAHLHESYPNGYFDSSSEFEFSIVKSQYILVEDPTVVPQEFITPPKEQLPVVDKRAATKAIKAGVVIPGCTLEERETPNVVRNPNYELALTNPQFNI